MPANPHRGEIEARLVMTGGDSQPFALRPTWQAIVQIEEATGEPIVDTYSLLLQGRVSFGRMVALLRPLLAAGGREMTRDQVAEAVYRTGLLNPDLIAAVANAIDNAIRGGREADGQGEARAPDGQSDDTRTGATGA